MQRTEWIWRNACNLTIALFSLMFRALFSKKVSLSESNSGTCVSVLGAGLASAAAGFVRLARLGGNFMATLSVNDLRVFLGGEQVSVSDSMFWNKTDAIREGFASGCVYEDGFKCSVRSQTISVMSSFSSLSKPLQASSSSATGSLDWAGLLACLSLFCSTKTKCQIQTYRNEVAYGCFSAQVIEPTTYRAPKTIRTKTVTAVIWGRGFHGNRSCVPVTAQVHSGGGGRRLLPLYNR